MTTAQTSLTFWISLLYLWVIVYWFYRDYRVDLFRQRLFEQRARLFDMALEGKLSFDSPAYVLHRRLINGFLRDAGRLGILTTILLSIALRGRDEAADEFETEWERAVDPLDPETKMALAQVRTDIHMQVAEQILIASPLALLTLLPSVLLIAIWMAGTRALGAGLRQLYQPFASATRRFVLGPLDSAALVTGAADAAAA